MDESELTTASICGDNASAETLAFELLRYRQGLRELRVERPFKIAGAFVTGLRDGLYGGACISPLLSGLSHASRISADYRRKIAEQRRYIAVLSSS